MVAMETLAAGQRYARRAGCALRRAQVASLADSRCASSSSFLQVLHDTVYSGKWADMSPYETYARAFGRE